MAAPLPDGSVGIAYGPVQLEATGGVPPYQWSACGLPADMYCDSDGLIQGVPADLSYGVWEVTATADDNAGFTAYGVKEPIIHAGVSPSRAGVAGYINPAPIDIVLPEANVGELRSILIVADKVGAVTPPTIAGWTDHHGDATATSVQWRWDRVKQGGDPDTITGVDVKGAASSWTGIVVPIWFTYGDPTDLVSEWNSAANSATMSFPGVTPTVVSDVVVIGISHGPQVLSQEGFATTLATFNDETIGWSVLIAEAMQWPADETIPGPMLNAAAASTRLDGWTFAMARVS